MSPQGDRAVTATEDHRLQTWELPSGRQLRELAVSCSLLSLHLDLLSCPHPPCLVNGTFNYLNGLPFT